MLLSKAVFFGNSAFSLCVPATVVVACAVCAIVLWFGWGSIRRNVVTKWIGVLIGLYLGLVLGLSAFGVAVGLSLVLLPLFLFALPYLMYDLLFRAPSEGHSARDKQPSHLS